MSPLRFAVIGLSGFDEVHLNAVAWLEKQGLAELTGVVAIEYDRRRFPEKIKNLAARNIPLYSSSEDFFQHGENTAEVLTVPIGIHQHVPVSLAALEAVLHVYCEKPAAATIQDSAISCKRFAVKLACFARRKFAGKPWAIHGKPFRWQNYRHFPLPSGDFARCMQQ